VFAVPHVSGLNGRRQVIPVRGRWMTSGTAVTAAAAAMLLAGAGTGSAGAFGARAAATSANRTAARPSAVFLEHPNAISCRSESLCMVVGAFGSTRSTMRPYSELWAGTRWRVLATPGPARAHALNSVSCVSRTSCVAVGEVGSSGIFADAWNGQRWRLLTVPSQQAVMNSISCPAAADCVAVGSTNGNAVADEWNGNSWRVLVMPTVPGAVSSDLGSVSCASPASCIAVGSYASSSSGNPRMTLAEAWDGTAWTVLADPAADPAGSVLSSVSCATAAKCVAVGLTGASSGSGSVLAEGWDGQSWKVLPAAVPPGSTTSSLSGVSCAGGSSCIAVGAYTVPHTETPGLAERWNGTSWQITKTPRPFAAGAVSCPAADSCVAAGRTLVVGRTLAEQWNGKIWQTLRMLRFDSLSGISCTGRTSCMAVGSYVAPAGQRLTLAERWNGRGWLVRASPTPLNFHGLSDISCVGSAFCMAVAVDRAGHSVVEQWDGRQWRVLTAPPGGVTAVSCSSGTRCMAVGGTAAAVWNGKRWQSTAVAVPKALSFRLADVSCAAANRCIAVGSKSAVPGADHAVAEAWNGRRWQILATHVLPPGDLNAVDCVGASACMAVGSLAAQWNGRKWRTLRTASSFALGDVSCVSGSDCLAVGSYSRHQLAFPEGASFQIAEHWNGRQWALERTPMRGGALSAVSCVHGPLCVAVGQVGGLNTSALAEQWTGVRLVLMKPRNP
jgi:hypothetical protein